MRSLIDRWCQSTKYVAEIHKQDLLFYHIIDKIESSATAPQSVFKDRWTDLINVMEDIFTPSNIDPNEKQDVKIYIKELMKKVNYFLADCSANLKLFDNGRYKFTPSENMNADDNWSYMILSWNYIPGHDFNYISFELDDIKKKYPDQANLQKYIDYLQDLELVQGNKSNYFYIKWTRREYLIRDGTNYLDIPNRHIPLCIGEPMALSSMTGLKELSNHMGVVMEMDCITLLIDDPQINECVVQNKK
ncbi:11915_t:CDS:2 [Entrophospora sp. SA101]|nr:11915_t:CDS:2 [Entrophospora sp. SA101]